MTEQKQVYKCEICGNITEVLRAGGGELVCCGQPMKLQEEKTEDLGKEKHVPVIDKTERGFKVRVGSVSHPMEEKHYIEWIELMPPIIGFKTPPFRAWRHAGPPETPAFRQGSVVRFIADGESCRKFLNPGEAPEAEFCVSAERAGAREYCNIHGLWKA